MTYRRVFKYKSRKTNNILRATNCRYLEYEVVIYLKNTIKLTFI